MKYKFEVEMHVVFLHPSFPLHRARCDQRKHCMPFGVKRVCRICEEVQKIRTADLQIFTVPIPKTSSHVGRRTSRIANGFEFFPDVSPFENAMRSLLVIDDDTELCEMLADYLRSEDFHVDSAHNAADGIDRVLSGSYALVILDVMLPGMNGFDALRRIRARSNIPVLMLTARGDDVDRIVGLEVGADDYLPKPFNPRELVARIRAVLRRAKASGTRPSEEEGVELLGVGDVEMDMGAHRVRLDGREVELTSVEFDLLGALLRSAGRVLSREEISRSVLKRRLHPLERSIDVHISSLRRKLGRQQDGVERIRTIRGIGYLYARPGGES